MTVYVTDDEAREIRRWYGGDTAWSAVSDPERVFLPIEAAVASGQASCRSCGHQIDKGETCIAFQFVSHPYAHSTRAYIHTDCVSKEATQ